MLGTAHKETNASRSLEFNQAIILAVDQNPGPLSAQMRSYLGDKAVAVQMCCNGHLRPSDKELRLALPLKQRFNAVGSSIGSALTLGSARSRFQAF